MEKELKARYNELVARWKKYEKFVENKDISMAEKLKWVPQAQKLTNEMSTMLDTMEGEDIKITEAEMFGGFADVL
jgi:hypothetical protein